MQQFFIHRNTRAVIAAWHDMCRSGSPDRAPVMASDYPGLTDGLFMLRRTVSQRFIVRAAGQTLCRLMDRPMWDADFLTIWKESDRTQIDLFLATTVSRQGPALIRGSAEGLLQVEIMLAPLDPPDATAGRLLGLYQPCMPEHLLRGRSVTEHGLISLQFQEPPRARSLRLVSDA